MGRRRLPHSLRLPWAGPIVVKFGVGKQVKKVRSFVTAVVAAVAKISLGPRKALVTLRGDG